MIYCDIAILVAVANVTTANVGFIKLAWIVTISVYAFVNRGRVVLAIRGAATVFAVAGALIRHDANLPILVIVTAPWWSRRSMSTDSNP